MLSQEILGLSHGHDYRQQAGKSLIQATVPLELMKNSIPPFQILRKLPPANELLNCFQEQIKLIALAIAPSFTLCCWVTITPR